jgi:hypothetical protein
MLQLLRMRILQKATAAACPTAVPIRLASARANLHHQLDDVDLCREVAGDLEADFLLAHGGLGPNLHFSFPPKECPRALQRVFVTR